MSNETDSAVQMANGDRNDRATGRNGQRQAFSDAEARSQAHWLARAMSALDVRPDDIVVSLMPNCQELSVARLGNALVGGDFLVIDPEISSCQLREEIRRSRARIILAHSANADGGHAQRLLLEAIPELRSAPDCTSLDLVGVPHLKAIVLLGGKADEPFVGENLLAEFAAFVRNGSVALPARMGATRLGLGRHLGVRAPSTECRSNSI